MTSYFIRRILQISTENVTLQVPFRGISWENTHFFGFLKKSYIANGRKIKVNSTRTYVKLLPSRYFFHVHFSFKNIIFYRTAPVGLIQEINLGGGSPEKINFYCTSVFAIYFIQFFTPSQILVYSLELHGHLCKNVTIHAKIIIMYFEFILSVLHRN